MIQKSLTLRNTGLNRVVTPHRRMPKCHLSRVRMIHDLFTGCVLEMNVVKSVGWKISKLYKSRNQSIKLLDTRKTDIHTEGSPRAEEFPICPNYW